MRFSRSIAVAALLLILGGVLFFWLHHPSHPSAELSTPKVVLERLNPIRGKTLFFSPAAAEFLKPIWNELRSPPLEEPQSGKTLETVMREMDLTLQNPTAWRAMDRKWRFSAVLLTGDPAEFRALLEHLRKSPDWTLTWLDHTSYLFERSPARAWTVSEVNSLKAIFTTHRASERVTMRVQVAHRLTAIGETSAAKELLEEAIGLDGRSAPALTEMACVNAACARWDQALALSSRAMAADKNYLPAIAAKANALYAFGKFNEALLLTRRLATETPEDGQNLALHARVTHSAHAYQEEIAALEKIIAMTKANGLPVGSWRIFLGQAYAASSDAALALKQFEEALREPGLSESEQAFVRKGIERINSHDPIF